MKKHNVKVTLDVLLINNDSEQKVKNFILDYLQRYCIVTVLQVEITKYSSTEITDAEALALRKALSSEET